MRLAWGMQMQRQNQGRTPGVLTQCDTSRHRRDIRCNEAAMQRPRGGRVQARILGQHQSGRVADLSRCPPSCASMSPSHFRTWCCTTRQRRCTSVMFLAPPTPPHRCLALYAAPTFELLHNRSVVVAWDKRRADRHNALRTLRCAIVTGGGTSGARTVWTGRSER